MYDLIIIGAGSAGLASAIYAARYKLKTLVICKDIGGVILEAYKVENYPGFKAISGIDLMNKFKKQAEELGVKIIEDEVIDIKKNNNFKINTKQKSFESKTIIIAMGSKRRKLDVPGSDEFSGKGVSYCATCDGPLFKNKIVGVVGGSDSAANAAQLLADYAKKVYIIYRKEKLRAEPLLVEQINKNKKIEIINNTNITEIKGDKMISSVIFDSGKEFKLDGLFIEIGILPNNEIAKKLGVKLDKEGHIIVDKAQKTNINGVYAAGDITNASNKFEQLTTATAEGSIAANSVYEFVKKII
jgi:thioredoxin reductase (NADPH)